MLKDSRLIAKIYENTNSAVPTTASTVTHTPAIPAALPSQQAQEPVKKVQNWVTLPYESINNKAQALHAASMIAQLCLRVCKDKALMTYMLAKIKWFIKNQ